MTEFRSFREQPSIVPGSREGAEGAHERSDPWPMPEQDGSACSLDAAGAERRTEEFADLARRALLHRQWASDREVALAFLDAPGIDTDLRRLIAREEACCSFFRFHLTKEAGVLRLRVTVPRGEVDYLRLLYAAVRPASIGFRVSKGAGGG